ncbi:metallo-beta-lactamase superfamily protein [Cladophialophora carrionii]|uniref:Metallo-beta-lactamase superfamily protein n=1 Tax=Cladophialophora carrionii TaxID=86049 RepID=A0A1C1CTE1_9EURO|nr:metallo-beta-lactamase superfamily protein [Cladophialophora carrionii]
MASDAQRKQEQSDALPAPGLNVPVSSHTCDIWAINTTCDIVCQSALLMGPENPGHENLNLPTFAFYIHNTRLNKRVLFDNGARKDWWNTTPQTYKGITLKGAVGIRVKENVYDILAAGGVDPDTIDAVVWSHFHRDHVGNIQLFPASTELVVGPGFQKSFVPGYPTVQEAAFYDADFHDRSLREITFDDSFKIGRFHAHDYFDDGSFYLLHTPGHTAGHLSGLVRTTPTTFVFLGGDICHFPAMFRPTPYGPMPSIIPEETKLDSRFPCPCPGSLFTASHPSADASEARISPYYHVPHQPGSWYEDPRQAQISVDGLKEFDAGGDVFIAIAHDPALKEIVEGFPTGKMNDWKAKGWDKQSRWHFVNELPIDGNPGRPLLVKGLLKDV